MDKKEAWRAGDRLAILSFKEVNLLKGLDEFLSIFGNITIKDVAIIIIAIVFMVTLYKKISDYLMKRHDARVAQEAQIKEALESTKKYPEYRQQSVQIQTEFKNEIQEIKKEQKELRQLVAVQNQRLEKIEEQNKKKERNKLRDILLERYRHYTNKETNPSQSWTKMEAEAFWELFRDYEDAGGDGYMHTVVQPEMERLIVIDM